jgi:hypothetical protein
MGVPTALRNERKPISSSESSINQLLLLSHPIHHFEIIPRGANASSYALSKKPPDQNEEGHLSDSLCDLLIFMIVMAPEVGLESVTKRTFNNLQVSGWHLRHCKAA